MKVISLYSLLMICMVVLAFPSAVRTEETSGNAVEKEVQTIEKKT
jgi:hypothetical protein